MSTAAAQPHLLEVRNLRVEFGSVVAVNDLSLHVDPGETLAVVGESGSGKSVTALAVMRLVHFGTRGRISEGEILFRAQSGEMRDLVRQPEPVMRDIRGNEISMIFQEPLTSRNPVYTVGDQIAETLMLHQGLDRAGALGRTLEMLERVRIPEAAKRLHEYPHQLSGGMRQRVMIAMALACDPKVLIADEPTTALDVTIQAQILELMRMLQDELGTAIILITHDMGVVAEVADRVTVMHNSRLVEEGAVHDIFERPTKDYTRALLRAVPRLGAMKGKRRPEKFVLIDEGPSAAPAPDVEPAASSGDGVQPLLKVKQLVKRFPIRAGMLRKLAGHVHAVEGVTFELAPGETLALVGESGCGKSTTGNLIMRLDEATDGRIEVEGTDITHLKEDSLTPFRRKMQMIFQDPFASLDPRRMAGDSVAEPMVIHGIGDAGERRDRVATLFRRVGLLPEHMRRFPHQFSGGQRQRICIARALALNPKLLIADEAVSALDVSIQAQVVNLLMDLQQEFGLGYLFISHDMAVVERISHRVAVMYLGQVVEIGSREAVFSDPRHSYTKKLLSAVPVADPNTRPGERRLLTGEIPSPIKPIGHEPAWHRLEPVAADHFVAAE